MNHELKSQLLIAAALITVWIGGDCAYEGINKWMDARSDLAMNQASVASIRSSYAATMNRLKRGDKVVLEKSIVEASLHLMFNLTDNATRHGVKAMINVVGGHGKSGTVDFKTISEEIPDVADYVRIPVLITITGWESSARLFSWLEKSVFNRQFYPTTMVFEGGMTIKGYIYGRES